MSGDTRKLYGPPGTGKTRALTDLALRAARAFGPERIAAVTFTRTAASELKERIASGLGLMLPEAPQARRRYLNQTLPWVGTIHSIALRLIGPSHVLKAADLTRFVHDMGGQPSATYADAEDAEGYAWAEPGRDEVEAALAVHAMARHRMIELAQAYAEAQWGFGGPSVSPHQVTHLVRAYADFKRDLGRIDFEDMLCHGLDFELPVDCVLGDEVQDNSPLLWAVLDRWSAGKLVALAGDPYQALYIWSGASPGLFINHVGQLHRLGDSHRLTQAAADRAQRTLLEGGYRDDEWLGTWTGTSQGQMRDGSVFWLARTGRLLQPVRADLEDAGTPYANIRGGGPLATKAADAYRVLLRLRTRGLVDAQALYHLASQNDLIPKRSVDRLKAIARQSPDEPFDVASAEAQLGIGLGALEDGFRQGEYFARVFAQHGPVAFRDPPRVQVGTIHSAKGREADTVHLVESWGTLPARALDEPEGRRAEACVAYVALTRHRHKLQLEPADSGTSYPW